MKCNLSSTLSTLEMRDYLLMVHLGCIPEERKEKQSVLISLVFKFATSPAACTTDQLSDTICYAKLSAVMQDHVLNRSFHTIEYLAHSLYEALMDPILSRNQPVQFTLRLHKVNPPIENLKGGVYFELSSNTVLK